MQLETIKRVITQDLNAVDFVLKRNLFSRVEHINEIVDYLEKNPGKKVRPLVLILVARALGYTGTRHIYFSVIIEMLHMATLLHDDVVDNSETRRSSLTVNKKWNNQTAVLLGDFIYSRAFQLMASLKNSAALSVLADATNALAEGELIQSSNVRNVFTTKKEYMRTIECKTAVLFSAAAEIGAILGRTSCKVRKTLQQYGQCVGIVYQLVDDILDYTAKRNELGKQTGNDLLEGKMTLPLLYALESDSSLRNLLSKVFKKKSTEKLRTETFDKVKQIIVDTKSVQKVCAVALEFTDKAACYVSKIDSSTDTVFYSEQLKNLPFLFLDKVESTYRSERDSNPRPSA